MKKKFLVMTALIIGSQLHAQDSTSTTTLDEVFVTASKFQQKQSSTGKMVTVINQQTLQRNAGKTISEIINYQAGVFINGASNNLGTNPDLYMRGSGLGNTLILIDGIPVCDPSQINNTFDLSMISLGQVERIEILKGAQSTLWGSGAVAGVINIITKKTTKNSFTPTAQLSYGSYQTLRGTIGVSGTAKKFSYQLGYDFTNSQGFSTATDSTGKKGFDKDNFIQNNWQAKFAYQLSDRITISSMHRSSIYKGGTDAGAFADDKDNVFYNNNLTNNIDLTYHANQIQIHLQQTFLKAGRVYTDDSTNIGGFAKYSKGTYNGNTAITELYGNIALTKKWTLVSGIQSLTQKTDQQYLSISAWGPYATALGDSAKANNVSVYNSLLLTGARGFDVEAGFRYNHHSIYGNNTTFTFNPSYHLTSYTKAFVNISTAYKIPSLYQLYSEYGNKQLQPEKSINYELGMQLFSNNKMSNIRFAGFKRDIKDLIIFYSNPVTYDATYINRDTQHDYGIELESTIAISKNASWINNITYVDGEGETNAVKVKNLYRRPNFTWSSVLNLQPTTSLTLMPSIRYVGTRAKGTYDAGPEKMPAYYTLDFYVGYAVTKKAKLFIDLRNITNQEYFEIVGYNSKRFNMMVGCNWIL